MPPVMPSIHHYTEGVKCTTAKKRKLKDLEGKKCYMLFKQQESIRKY